MPAVRLRLVDDARDRRAGLGGLRDEVAWGDSASDHFGCVALEWGPLTYLGRMKEQLERVGEEWSRALAIVAHPDDLEYGTAAAVARWTSQGKHIAYCLATSGEAGIDAVEPERCGPLREQEERDSAAAVGVDSVEFLGHPDGMLEYGLPLRRDVARAIRRYRPEVVITGYFGDSWAPGALNQADHIAVGRCVVDGVRDAGNRWVFRELLDEGLEPCSVTTVLVSSPFGTHGVDVTEHFDQGVASLEAHREYLKGLGEHGMADPREFLESMARPSGSRLGVRFGVRFDVITV